MVSSTQIFQYVISGVTVGSTYGLTALGFITTSVQRAYLGKDQTLHR
jgi:hypothetical protein